jgi:hypothetical protein
MRSEIVLITLLLSGFVFDAIGQYPQKQNSVYLELGGNALFASVNYERQIFKKSGLGFHIGTGIYGVKPSYSTIPFGVNYLFRISNSNRYLDLGIGVTYSKADVMLYVHIKPTDLNYVNTNYWNYVPSVGFKWMTSKNFMFRFSVAPVINQYDLIPFVGLAAGKCF